MFTEWVLGHLSYTTEINTLANSGFIVLSYDNTGNCISEGKNQKGFFQAVLDLNSALNFINQEETLKTYPVSLIGHSWGAYAVCQVLQFKTNIKSVVAFSGFDDSSVLLCDMIKLNIFKPFFKILNLLTFGPNSLKSTQKILQNTNIPIFLLHGKLDDKVSFKNSLVSNKKLLEKENIHNLIFEDKLHNVYQTKESENYLNTTFSQIEKLNKQFKGKELEEKLEPIYRNIDYKKITEEDIDIMNLVTNFLTETLKS